MRFIATILAVAAVQACELESEAQGPAPAGYKWLSIKSVKARDDKSGVFNNKKIMSPEAWNKSPHKKCMSAGGVPQFGKYIEAYLEGGYHYVKQIRVFTEPTFDQVYTAK